MKLSTVALMLIAIVMWIPSGLLGCGLLGSENDAVKVIFVEWKRGDVGITTRPFKQVDLTQEEINSLTSQHVSGVLNVVGYQIHGSRSNPKPRRIIIVMDHQIDKTVDFRQPSNSDVIYLQFGNEWKILPHETATSERIIRLELNRDYKNQTMYWFQLPDGPMEGKTAFLW